MIQEEMDDADGGEPMEVTVAVVGPGAIGTTVAAALHEVGHMPVLCGRTPRQRLELHAQDGVIVVPGPVRTDPGQVEGPVDLVFLEVPPGLWTSI